MIKEIKIEEVKVERYKDEEVIGKVTKCYYSPCEIKEVIIDDKTYLRDGEDVEVDWLNDKLFDRVFFYDKKSGHRIDCVSFEKDGKIIHAFTDHDD